MSAVILINALAASLVNTLLPTPIDFKSELPKQPLTSLPSPEQGFDELQADFETFILINTSVL
jgi:hypothetical protein